jgi:Ca-activated chloride channel family protein
VQGRSHGAQPTAQAIPSETGHAEAVTVPGLGLLSLSGFENPLWLVLLVVPAAILAVYVVANERRRQRMRRFADPAARDSIARSRPSRWRHLPMAVLLLALVPLTIAVAQPSHDVRVPRNRAVIMLLIDVSPSMTATDVPPTRLIAAQHAAQQFARQVTPGVNLGLISFAGTANVLVAPSPDHELTVSALDRLRSDDSTATGQAIFAALQSIQTVNAVLKGPADKPPPARIVLLSDGKENKPGNPNNPQGAYTAARAAKQQGVPISTIAFGTPTGHVAMKNETVPVPVDTDMMKTIARLSGGQTAIAENVDELIKDFSAVEDQLGYQVERGPASAGWLRVAVILGAIGAMLGLLINRRLPA